MAEYVQFMVSNKMRVNLHGAKCEDDENQKAKCRTKGQELLA